MRILSKLIKNIKEEIIKLQHNCKATGFWVNKSKLYNFLLIMHEHIFVFQKQCKEARKIKTPLESLR